MSGAISTQIKHKLQRSSSSSSSGKNPSMSDSISGTAVMKWFEITENTVTYWSTADKLGAPEGHITVQSIADIRSFTTDRNTMKQCNQFGLYCFEIETATTIYIFTTENRIECSNWLTSLNIMHDNYVMSISAYHMQLHTLTVPEIINFVEKFKMYGHSYTTFTHEQRAYSIEHCGIDISSVSDVSTFLHKEVMATGLSAKYLAILQEFLLIPVGSEGTWDAILSGEWRAVILYLFIRMVVLWWEVSQLS